MKRTSTFSLLSVLAFSTLVVLGLAGSESCRSDGSRSPVCGDRNRDKSYYWYRRPSLDASASFR